MPAAVIPIGAPSKLKPCASWSLLELALPGVRPEPLGILLLDYDSERLHIRLRPAADFDDVSDEDAELIDLLPADLEAKSREMNGRVLLESLEDSLSNFVLVSGRTEMRAAGDPSRLLDRLFDEFVDSRVQPFVTHIPVYTLRAAATKFGEQMDVEQGEWMRAPKGLRLTPDLFVAQVVGRSMEPRIPDGSLCVFRSNVTGSRQEKLVLIEMLGSGGERERYTIKRYRSVKTVSEEGDWAHAKIRLEPLNLEFEAFELGEEDFRVVAEFVQVLS